MTLTKNDTFTCKTDKYSTYTYTGKTVKGKNHSQADKTYIFTVNNGFDPVTVGRTESWITDYFKAL